MCCGGVILFVIPPICVQCAFPDIVPLNMIFSYNKHTHHTWLVIHMMEYNRATFLALGRNSEEVFRLLLAGVTWMGPVGKWKDSFSTV